MPATEVQRKSILDCHLIISSLLSNRDRLDMTPEELAQRAAEHFKAS